MVSESLRDLKKVPRTILGVTELRRDPQKVFDLAKKQGRVLITEFSQPQGVILSLETFDGVVDVLDRLEAEDALDSVGVYRREKKDRTLKKLNSLESLSENGS